MLSAINKIAIVEQHCSNSGVRLTDKRKQVLSCLIEADSALSAYDVISLLQRKYDIHMQAMSVYRILDFLHGVNLIHKLELVNKYIVCSHIACDHEHEKSQFLICSKCTSVSEVSFDKTIIDNLKKLAERSGYFLSADQLEFSCVCKSCSDIT